MIMQEPSSSAILDVSDADFSREVIERSRERPVVVDFWAPWCGPCRALGPMLERLVAEHGGEVVLAKVNIDKAPRITARFGIAVVPTVVAIRDGQPVQQFTGLLPEAQLRQFLERLLPSEADRLSNQAAALEATDPAQAEALYRRAVAQGRPPVTALLGLARVQIAQGKEEGVAELLEQVGNRGETGEEAERLGALLYLRRLGREYSDEAALRARLEQEPASGERRYELGCALAAAGRYPEALATLLAAVEQDRKLADRVREVMVKVFHVIGVRSSLADEYRDKLVRVLY
jgi:putative thioredoxin